MKKNLFLLATVTMFTMSGLHAQTVQVGGEPMYPQKNIVENAVNSKAHTTLVAAVKAAGLVETLASKGPFTVFAPVNAAFESLPAGTVETLLKPENKAALQGLLTYHVLAGRFDAEALMTLIKKSNGIAKVKTVKGDELTLTLNGKKNILLQDAQGNFANINVYDVYQSNGILHSIDAVLIP